MRRIALAAGTFALAWVGWVSQTTEGGPGRPGARAAPPRSLPTRTMGAGVPVRIPSPAEPGDSYLDDLVMVQPAEGADLVGLADRHGSVVLRPPGPAGWAGLAVPSGLDAPAFVASLVEDPEVDRAARVGRTFGASRAGASQLLGAADAAAYDPGAHQWHLDAAGARSLPQVDLNAVVVAILDTGVAFEDRVQGRVRYVAAPSLRDVRIVAPWDFINGDAHPSDDHQHGTHIASLIASRGRVNGVAPGVAIMPLKVLDEEDVGTELALVDGLNWAVAHGADVINMSLSFGVGYVPSEALVAALERAAEAGIVLVSAAGNEGLGVVTQPAANPLVLAVGAIRPEGKDRFGPAPYSNTSPRVDLVAPGGSVDKDRDGDGFVDGLLAETIALKDPSRVGYWLYAGTSQAAALVSATAARLVGLGVPADEVRTLLQASARPEVFAPIPFADGLGRGRLHVSGALSMAAQGRAPRARDFYVAMLAWIEPGAGGLVRPVALLTVLDESAELAEGVQVAGTLDGPGGGTFHCVARGGSCRVAGAWTPAARGTAWTFASEAVIADGVSFHPGTAVFAGEGLQAMVAEMRDNEDTADAVLGFRWTPGLDPVLGRVAEADLLVDLGVARATSPVAMVMTDGVLAPEWLEGAGTLHVTGGQGAGLSVRASRIPGRGPRWSVYRVPGEGMRLFRVDASALADGPLRFGAKAMLSPGTAGWRAVLVGTGTLPGPVTRNRWAGRDWLGTPVGEWLRDGGWTTAGGQPAAAVLKGAAAPRR